MLSQQIKRKSIFDHSSNEKIQKTSTENLSNEIFYEIFDYLDGIDLYNAFSNLNEHFQQLLYSSSLRFKIKFDYFRLKEICFNDYKDFLHEHKQQIISMNLWISESNYDLIPSINIDSSFLHLESIIFDEIQTDIFISLIPKLISLPRFSSLNITILSAIKDLKNFYQLFFQLSKLTYLQCTLDLEYSTTISSLPIITTHQFSSIKHLIIYHHCDLKELFHIISYTPQLEHFKFINEFNKKCNIKQLPSIQLANLTSLSMDLLFVKFKHFEIFTKKILSPKLKVLSVEIYSDDMNFINANQWKNFIWNYCPQLDKFYLKYKVYYRKRCEAPFYNGEKNEFLSQFWLDRQWIYEAEIDHDEILYLIRPYKIRWYDYDIQHRMIDSPDEYWKSSRLIIFREFRKESQWLLSRDIGRIMCVTSIFHLEIYEVIPTNELIDILICFLLLDSLYIRTLLLSNTNELSDQYEFLYNFFLDKNRIRKIYFEKFNHIEEIYFLFKLCPYVEYLKVNNLNNIDMETFLISIIKSEYSRNLRLLCCRIPAADDQMIEKFKQMIGDENLLVDYTIKRVVDNIFIQWK